MAVFTPGSARTLASSASSTASSTESSSTASPPAERRPLWRTARFFFCTPHIVNNDVNSGLADPHRFVCVVYDEVHHAHASGSEYARLAKLFRAREAKVRVLGLSATAGRDLHLEARAHPYVECPSNSSVEARRALRPRPSP